MAFLPEQSTYESMATLLMVRRLYPRLREEQRSDPQSQVHGDYYDGRNELPVSHLLYREDIHKGDRIHRMPHRNHRGGLRRANSEKAESVTVILNEEAESSERTLPPLSTLIPKGTIYKINPFATEDF